MMWMMRGNHGSRGGPGRPERPDPGTAEQIAVLRAEVAALRPATHH
jgi:hypothetical protein